MIKIKSKFNPDSYRDQKSKFKKRPNSTSRISEEISLDKTVHYVKSDILIIDKINSFQVHESILSVKHSICNLL